MTEYLQHELLALTRSCVHAGKVEILDLPILPDYNQISKMAGIYLDYKCENGTQSWDAVLFKTLVMSTMTTFDVKPEDFIWARNLSGSKVKKTPTGLRLIDITLRITGFTKMDLDIDDLEAVIRKISAMVDFQLRKGTNLCNDFKQYKTSVKPREDQIQFDWIILVLTLGLRVGWFKETTTKDVLEQAALHGRGEISWRDRALDLPLIPQMYERRILIKKDVPSGCFSSVDAVREMGRAVSIWKSRKRDVDQPDADGVLIEPLFEEDDDL